MSIANRAFNNIFWLSLGEASSRVLSFLGTIYLARILGKAGFGLFSLSIVVGGYFWAIADMGITDYGTREIARKKEHAAELYSILNSIRIILSIALFIVFSGALYFLDMPFEKKIVLLAGAFYIVGYSLSADWVLRGLEKMQYIFYGRMATSCFFLGGIYLLVKNSSDTFRASIIYSFSFVIGSLIFVLLLSRKLMIPFSLKISFEDWWFHIKEAFYFALNGIFNTIAFFIPILFMGFWNSDEDIGIFSAPHRFVMFFVNAFVLIVVALYPILSNLYVSNKGEFGELFVRLQKLIIFITIPLCVIATALSRDMMILFFGNSYADSAGIFNIFIWYLFFRVIRAIFGISLFSAGFHRFNMYATGTGAAFVILLSLMLISRYKAYGAVWALLLGEVLILVLLSNLARKRIHRQHMVIPYLIKVLSVSVVMTFVIRNLPYPLILRTIIGICVFSILSLAIGIVDKNAFQKVYEWIVKNRRFSRIC